MASNARLRFSQAVEMIGTTGIRCLGNMIIEEFQRDLRGSKGRAAYKEMAANCSAMRRGYRLLPLPLRWKTYGSPH